MKQNNIVLDIAILTAGREDLFGKCVDAIMSQMKPEYRISVCNNGHPSSEYEKIYKFLPPNSIIKRNKTDDGYSRGANSCMNAGNAPLVLLVTDDVFLHDGAIEHLLETMKDPSIGQCGLKLLFPVDGSDPNRPAGKVQHIGMATNIRGDMIHPLIGWSPDNPKCNISREVVAVTGACFIVRRDDFRRAGGFNPIYGTGYFEDMDLSYSIRTLGKRIYIDTESVATHGVGQTFAVNKKESPMQQNSLIFKNRWIKSMAWSEWDVW
jgi:GT2 family glycosyltransferase